MRIPHHFHIRKRLEPYPSKRTLIRALDVVVYVVGILGPLATIPQVIKIYAAQDATGVSVLSWGIYALFDITWIVYAIVHKERPLIICYSLWFFFNVLVTVGALVYGTAGALDGL